MSKISKFALGDRVQLIPFKHKGKQGHIKYIGEIEGKAQGNWVGIELDEANGENNGEFNDVQIFECQEGHGIFLRPTQVKSLELTSDAVSRYFFIFLTKCVFFNSRAKWMSHLL